MISIIDDGDIKEAYEIYSFYVKNTNISFELVPPTLEKFKEKVKNIKSLYPYLVYKEDGHVLGYAYASRFRTYEAYDNCTELSNYVDKAHQHEGIGSKLLTKIIEILKIQNVMSLISCVTYPNLKSDNLHLKFGFKSCGHMHKCGVKNGEILDISFYEYIINESYNKFIPISEVDYGKII